MPMDRVAPIPSSRALVLGLFLLAGANLAQGASQEVQAFNRHLDKGINLGDLLEAPHEGAWGIRLESKDLATISAKGFRHVRVPIRWDGQGDDVDSIFERASRTPPYTVDPRFFARVDSCVAWARRNHLLVVLNDHHHDSLFANYQREVPRFLSIWNQVAVHFKDLPTDSVAFEILNEPHGQLTFDRWNDLLDTTLKAIRASNPRRPVVVGTADWGGTNQLFSLKVPSDSDLILTVHDYDPQSFTYQGATFIAPEMPTGVKWGGYWDLRQALDHTDQIATFAKSFGLPVYIGEFGLTYLGDAASRVAWAATKARSYERRGFSWAWWDFKEPEMGLYRTSNSTWNAGLSNALFSKDTSLLALGNPPATDTDVILNGFFDRDTGWFLALVDGGIGSYKLDSGSALMAMDSTPTGIAWAVELCQKNLLLEGNRSYLLQFSAWSDTPTTIDAWVGHGASPWPMYASSGGLRLGRNPTTFHTGFKTDRYMDPDSNSEVCFNLGVQKAGIRIDSVHLFAVASSAGIASHGASPSGGIRLEKTKIVAFGERAPSRSVVDARGSRVATLDWHRSTDGWTADARWVPRHRVLFLERSNFRFVLPD